MPCRDLPFRISHHHHSVGLLVVRRCSTWRTSTARCPIIAMVIGIRVCAAICRKSPLTNRWRAVHAWKHRFTSECMSVVVDQAFGAKSPSYSTVLQLDRKLRAFPVPPNLQIAGFGSATSTESHHQENVMLVLQRHIVLAIREMSKRLVSQCIWECGKPVPCDRT